MSTIGLYDTVSIADVREQAKLNLLMQNDNSIDDEIDFSITRGLQRMNCLSAIQIINCTIDVCGYTAKLPKGLIRLLAIRIPNVVVDYQSVASNYIYFYDKPFFTEQGLSLNEQNCQPFGNTVQQNNGYLMFNIEQVSDEMQIAYIGSAIDECGNIKIFERYSDALAAFASYRFANSRLHLRIFTKDQVQEWKNEWLNQRGMIQGQDAYNKFKEQQNQIRRIMYTPYVQPIQLYFNQ